MENKVIVDRNTTKVQSAKHMFEVI
uniref:Uncharacterized protein n=1 Tax=Anguilla anguilla TaxID=7936 RepID=A0A0E9S7W1_ANGAN